MISTGLQQSLGIIYSNICRRVAMRLDYVLIMCTNFRFDCEYHWEGLRNHLEEKDNLYFDPLYCLHLLSNNEN